MATGSYLSVITLNVNGLNAPTKRQRLAEWIQKQDPYTGLEEAQAGIKIAGRNINNYLKCKWVAYPSQKTKTG